MKEFVIDTRMIDNSIYDVPISHQWTYFLSIEGGKIATC